MRVDLCDLGGDRVVVVVDDCDEPRIGHLPVDEQRGRVRELPAVCVRDQHSQHQVAPVVHGDLRARVASVVQTIDRNNDSGYSYYSIVEQDEMSKKKIIKKQTKKRKKNNQSSVGFSRRASA